MVRVTSVVPSRILGARIDQIELTVSDCPVCLLCRVVVHHGAVWPRRRNCWKAEIAQVAGFGSEGSQAFGGIDLIEVTLWRGGREPLEKFGQSLTVSQMSRAGTGYLRVVLDCFRQGAGVFLAADIRAIKAFENICRGGCRIYDDLSFRGFLVRRVSRQGH